MSVQRQRQNEEEPQSGKDGVSPSLTSRSSTFHSSPATRHCLRLLRALRATFPLLDSEFWLLTPPRKTCLSKKRTQRCSMFTAFSKNRTQKRTQYYVPIIFQRPERDCVADQPQRACQPTRYPSAHNRPPQISAPLCASVVNSVCPKNSHSKKRTQF